MSCKYIYATHGLQTASLGPCHHLMMEAELTPFSQDYWDIAVGGYLKNQFCLKQQMNENSVVIGCDFLQGAYIVPWHFYRGCLPLSWNLCTMLFCWWAISILYTFSLSPVVYIHLYRIDYKSQHSFSFTYQCSEQTALHQLLVNHFLHQRSQTDYCLMEYWYLYWNLNRNHNQSYSSCRLSKNQNCTSRMTKWWHQHIQHHHQVQIHPMMRKKKQ